MSEKVDKRTKEYKDSVAGQNDNLVATKNEQISNLEQKVEDMKTMMQTIGKITANNAEAIKKQPKGPEVKSRGKNSNAYRKTVYPRYEEWKVLKKFTSDIMSLMVAYPADCAAICGGMMLYDVDLVLKVLDRNSKAHEEAKSQGITTDFKTVIVPKKDKK